LIVVPDGLCSVHATEAFAGALARLCGVKVKLTIRFPPAIRLAIVRLLYSSPVFFEGPAGHTGGVKQFGHRAGGVEKLPPSLARKDRHEGGLSQSPPLLVFIDIFPILGGWPPTSPLAR
jgi:hypothetical protein